MSYCQGCADRIGLLIQAEQTLLWFWETYHSCACGARAESLATHPHVTGCPVERALQEQAKQALGGE